MNGFSDYSEAPETGRSVQKRNRKPVSCTPCRQRKLRCDQALPVCDSCVRRGDVISCTYQFRKAGSQRHWPSSHASSSSNVQNRVDRLEQLLLTFIHQGGGAAGGGGGGRVEAAATPNRAPPRLAPAPQQYETPMNEMTPSTRTVDPASSRMIRVNGDYDNPSSIREAHWSALLNELHEVRGYVQAQQKQYDEQSQRISQLLKRTADDPGPALLFGASQVLGYGEILAHIPSRYICDMLVERYFSTLDPALHILHPPTFRKQYSEHWEDPHRTPVPWVGMLFAVMRIAALSWKRDADEPLELQGKCEDLSRSYRTRVADCLLLADYTKPHEYLIETLVLHLFGEYASHQDADSSSWVLLGTIIRLGTRMGYHRDQDRIPSLTPFQAEMRRRVWAFIFQVDILFSFQHGLPSMVEIGPTLTGLPRNIYDDRGFGPGCTDLPAARPISEATPISYLICKAQLVHGLGLALKQLNQEDAPPPYEKVIKTDRRIRELYAQVPEHFRLQAMAEQQHDQPTLITARFALANIYYKTLVVVHSRFLEAARVDARFVYSRQTCLQSAMAQLSLQAIQHQTAVATAGQTRKLSKYMTSLTAHDYLLAATILSTELCLDHKRDSPAVQIAGPTREEMIESLDCSVSIWSQMRDESIEAYKASDVLGMLLSKLRPPKETIPSVAPLARFHPALPSLPLPHNVSTPPVRSPYPGIVTSNPGPMSGPPQSAYIPQERLAVGPLDRDTASNNPTVLGSMLNPTEAPNPTSTSAYSWSGLAGERPVNHQDYAPAPTDWEQFTAPFDFSDPVSTLWSLNPGGGHF